MDKSKIIIHRANSPIFTTSPLLEIKYFYDRGFTNFEIDIYATSMDTYKFCHPIYSDKVDAVYGLDNDFLSKVTQNYPDVKWYVDIKYLDLQNLPYALMRFLSQEISNGVFTSSNIAILKYFKQNGHQTGQYFKKDNQASTIMEPDVYFDNENELTHPLYKTIVYCKSSKNIAEMTQAGYRAVITDGINVV